MPITEYMHFPCPFGLKEKLPSPKQHILIVPDSKLPIFIEGILDVLINISLNVTCLQKFF